MRNISFLCFCLCVLGSATWVEAGKIELTPYNRFILQTYWQLIFPGTKWCGDGDIAEDYDDLGIFKETDICCRDHDYCDDILLAGEEKEGLVNDGKFTRLHCKCDYALHDCLKAGSSDVSALIGIAYFNVLNGQCYEENHPATCVEYETGVAGIRDRCVKYEYDETQPKLWQWFDVPEFIDFEGNKQ